MRNLLEELIEVRARREWRGGSKRKEVFPKFSQTSTGKNGEANGGRRQASGFSSSLIGKNLNCKAFAKNAEEY
jgi:hypothetical protein